MSAGVPINYWEEWDAGKLHEYIATLLHQLAGASAAHNDLMDDCERLTMQEEAAHNSLEDARGYIEVLKNTLERIAGDYYRDRHSIWAQEALRSE